MQVRPVKYFTQCLNLYKCHIGCCFLNSPMGHQGHRAGLFFSGKGDLLATPPRVASLLLFLNLLQILYPALILYFCKTLKQGSGHLGERQLGVR